MNPRIIARLDIKGPNLVKGIHLEGLRVLGKPEQFAKYYYEQGVDELIYMDVVASLYERNSLNDIITRTAKEVFIPLTVGGGIRSIEDINDVLRAGADKVCINTAAIKNPNLISEAAQKFGSSTIVIAIEALKQTNGQYLAFTDNGREATGKEVYAWAKQVEELGAGEILITSVDKEGTGKGFDLELVSKVSANSSIPVIAHGGCGKKEDIVDVFKNTQSHSVAIASIIHYDSFLKHSNRKSAGEGNIDFLNSGGGFTHIKADTIPNIKKYLLENQIRCRMS